MSALDPHPKVSIGIPTYNRAGLLRRAAESVHAQDYRDFELLISDNASTDGTPALGEELSRRDSRVRYIRQPTNRGPTANFVDLVQQARGEFFMWLADDDWLDPAYVSQCLSFMVAHPDYALVCGSAKYYRGEEFAFRDPLMNLFQDSARERVIAYLNQVNMNGEHYGLMRRTQLLKVPYRHIIAGDWLLIASITFMGKLKTLGSVSINRSCEGMSRDIQDLARYFGFSGSSTKGTYVTIARVLLRDIGWESPVYNPLGKLERLQFAVRAAGKTFVRLAGPSWEVRRRLRELLKTVVAPGADHETFTIKALQAQMRYDVSELTITPGAQVKIVLENT
ncbi:MAG: glycosyltransferase, partial [Verrucomicrobiota bacterium]|nr:glycosyltransferase [Verrucomicrobiota bacterium]